MGNREMKFAIGKPSPNPSVSSVPTAGILRIPSAVCSNRIPLVEGKGPGVDRSPMKPVPSSVAVTFDKLPSMVVGLIRA